MKNNDLNHDWMHGLYRLPTSQRQQIISDQFSLADDQQALMKENASQLGSQLIENYLTDYRLPEGVVTNLVVNHKTYAVPVVTEEPSVVAAACNGANRAALSGGFTAPAAERAMLGQVVLKNVADPAALNKWLLEHETEILAVANAAHPSMQRRGGGAKRIRIRPAAPFVSVDLIIGVGEAMGANTVNTMAEAVAHYLKEQGYDVLTAILSNAAFMSLQSAACRVSFKNLATATMNGEVVAQRIAELNQLAQVDPYRAATHNKGIMNGIDALMIASGNDWRAIESGAYAYAASSGQLKGLSTWEIDGDALLGRIKLPLPVGTVGGSIGLNPLTRLNFKINGIHSAGELARVAASLGLAQNLAALRALATSGIQAGHMQMQYRSLAIALGATAAEVPVLVKRLKKLPQVNQDVAKQALQELRKDSL